MKRTIALTIPLLLIPAAFAAVDFGTTTSIATATIEDFDKLQEKYAEALAEWTEDVANAENLSERRALKDKHPAKAWWSKFERAGKSEGRALLWLIDNLENKGLDAAAAGESKSELLGRLVDKHVGDECFGDVMQILRKEKGYSEEALEGIYRTALEKSTHKAVQAQALYRVADLYKKSSDKEKSDQVDALMRKVAADFPGTKYGTIASSKFVTAADLEDGKPAPDFYGETIDGHGFALSDYKGKVVLVDFYGFW